MVRHAVALPSGFATLSGFVASNAGILSDFSCGIREFMIMMRGA
jgi:hypothetical protein